MSKIPMEIQFRFNYSNKKQKAKHMNEKNVQNVSTFFGGEG